MQNLIPHFIYTQYIHNQHQGQFEALTLYVDISGFTQLTEALMQQHKDGAEILSNAINRVFAPLVAQVYQHAGFIVNFAGDAFSAVFPIATPFSNTRDTAVQHVLYTAAFIQDFVSQHGQLTTKYGDFTLGVKVGIGAGTVMWYILGNGTCYTYYIYGPALTMCFEAEKHAQSGDILISNPLAQEYNLNTQNESASAYAKVWVLPTLHVDSVPTIVALPAAAMRPFIQDAIIELINRNAPAEFRQVVAIFITFDLPAAAFNLLKTFTLAILNLVTDYQGYFNKLDFSDKGSLMVVLFGAPIAHEHDLARAADFLLALRQQTAAWARLRWKVGVTYGTVYAGLIGGQERCEYGAIGDVMNLACRIMQHAAWGQIWFGENIAKQLSASYHVNALAAYTFKGKRDPQLIYTLSAKKTWVATLYTGRMISREPELTALRAAIQPIFAGQFAGLTCIRGEAGIGKTRLIHSLAQQLSMLQPIRWCTCPADALLRQSLNPFKYMLRSYFKQSENASAHENRTHFEAVLDTLRQHLAAKEPENPQIKPLLAELDRTRSILAALVDVYWPDSLYAQLDPQLRFHNTLRAFKTFIQAEAICQPVILHIEDGQWLDPDSQQMLLELTRALTGWPVALLFTSRQNQNTTVPNAPMGIESSIAEHVPYHVIHLQALTAPAIRAIAEQCLQAPISDEVAELLIRKTDGNPFFAEQLTLNLQEYGWVSYNPAGTWYLTMSATLTVPNTLNGVLIARLDQLSIPVRQTVQTAAVLGREFEVPILARMLPNAENLASKLQQAVEKAIWSRLSQTRYHFQQALMRDAAYEMQMRAQLRALHHRAAAAITAVYTDNLAAHYADLAYHYDQAAMYPEAAAWYQRAGEHAAAQFANIEAITALTRALALIPEHDNARRYAIVLTRERVYNLQGQRAAQQQDLTTLRTLADAAQQAEIALREASYAEVMGDFHAAITAAQRTLQLARANGELYLEGAGQLRWGRALWRMANYEAAHPHLKTALQLIQQAHHPALEADCLRNLGNINWSLGKHHAAMQYYRRALPLYHRTKNCKGESATLNNIGIVMMDVGDYATAQTYSQQALRLAQKIGSRISMGIARGNLGDIAFQLGEYDTAADYYQQFLQTTQATQDLPGNCEGLLGLARIAQQCDQPENAQRYSQAALTIAQRIDDSNLAAYAWLYLGYALTGLGQIATAQAAYTAAITLRRQTQQWHLATEPLAGLSLLKLTHGDSVGARGHVNEIRDYIAETSLNGTREPFSVYLACVRVLQITAPELAEDVLREAYHILQTRAAKISTRAMQRAYLENVPAHREIVRLWEAEE